MGGQTDLMVHEERDRAVTQQGARHGSHDALVDERPAVCANDEQTCIEAIGRLHQALGRVRLAGVGVQGRVYVVMAQELHGAIALSGGGYRITI